MLRVHPCAVRGPKAVLARPVAQEPAVPAPTVAQRIAALRRELESLEQQQRQALITTIRLVVEPGEMFSAKELFAHHVVSPELAAALDDAGITSVRKLGKRLRQLWGAGVGLERIGLDHNAALYIVR